MRKTVVVAVLAAALFLLAGFAVLTAPTSQSAVTPAKPAVAPVLAGQPTATQVESLAAVATQVGLSTHDAGMVASWLESLGPGQLALLKSTYASGQAPSKQTLEALKVPALDINYYCLGASVVAGAVIGGAVGSLGSPVGTAFGAIFGGVVGLVVGFDECTISASNAAQATAYAQVMLGAYGNEYNITNADYLTLMSLANATDIGWQRAADHAALFQLGNATFNVSSDLLQSGIYLNLAPLMWGYQYELGAELSAVITQFNGHWYSGDVFAGGSPALGADPAEDAAGDLLSVGDLLTTSTSNVYLPGGDHLLVSGFPQTYYNELTRQSYTITSCAVGEFGGECPWNFTGPTGVYDVWLPSGSPSVEIGSGQIEPATNGQLGWNSQGQDPFYSIGDSSSVVVQPSTSTQFYLDQSSQIRTAEYNPGNPTYAGKPGVAVAANFGSWLDQIEWQAALNAQTYWAFLRAAGWSSASQVPADCLVPEPYMVLPSALNETDLNLNETYSLYLSSLQGFAHFYNVSLNATNFCGTQAVKQWSIGGNVWGNLFINATGYIYLDNGTAQVTYSGTVNSHEAFLTPDTWSIGNLSYAGKTYLGPQQLLIMPTIASVSVPVGQAWAVPADNPVEVYVVQPGLSLWLTGNGTYSAKCDIKGYFCSQVAPSASTTPGDSLFLTSCVVSGQATNNCTVTVQTVNVTVANITCAGPCSQSAGGTYGGFPNIFSWLAGLLSGLFGGWSGLVADIIIAALLIIGVYVAYVELTAWGEKKRREPAQ